MRYSPHSLYVPRRGSLGLVLLIYHKAGKKINLHRCCRSLNFRAENCVVHLIFLFVKLKGMWLGKQRTRKQKPIIHSENLMWMNRTNINLHDFSKLSSRIVPRVVLRRIVPRIVLLRKHILCLRRTIGISNKRSGGRYPALGHPLPWAISFFFANEKKINIFRFIHIALFLKVTHLIQILLKKIHISYCFSYEVTFSMDKVNFWVFGFIETKRLNIDLFTTEN